MKTYETEKHNIPEGATHYIEESKETYFSWLKSVDGVSYYYSKYLDNDWRIMEDQNRINQSDVSPIPQTKEVGWVNGDEVKYTNPNGGMVDILTFVGIHPTHKDHAVLYGTQLLNGYMSTPLSTLSKPETPQEREKREWIESFASEIKNVGTMTYEEILGRMYDSLKRDK